VRNHNIVALISDLHFVISWALALLGLIFRFLNLTILPVDLSGWQVSVKSANYVAAMLPNTLGATEGVLRIAAVGSDFKLFLKVVLALYLLSAIGRSASGATVIYTGMFFLPYAFTEILSHPTPKSVHMRHFKENCIACMGPPRFLRLQAIYGHTSAALIACWFSIILQHCGSSSLFLSLKK
jgi:hypothetical protein